jgi:putative copper export protein
MKLLELLQAAAQTTQQTGPPGAVGRPPGPPPGFSYREAFFQLVQFVGFFLAMGAIGFRFGIVRQARGITDEAKRILRPENAALLGIAGILLLYISFLGGPYFSSITEHKAFVQALPKNLGPFEFRMAMLLLALIGFATARGEPGFGWPLAAIGIIVALLFPVYTGRGAGKVNAVHVFAASTWLGTLLVLTLVGIRGVIRAGPPGLPRAELVCDLVNAFSPLALTAASVVALTGLTTAWMHLKRLSALWTTSYGVALVVKLVFVACVVAMGAWNWKRVRPSLGDHDSEHIIRRSATMELTFGALVLLATSVLVTLPSPR